jgi:N-acetylmuramoyl-L-alanine amidase
MFDSRTRTTSGQHSAIMRHIYDQNRRLGETGNAACTNPAKQRRHRASRWALRAFFFAGVPLLYALAPTAQQLPASVAPTASTRDAAVATATGTLMQASFGQSDAMPAGGDAQPRAPVVAMTASPAIMAPLVERAELALALADVAPLVSGAVNLKSLFGLSVRNIVIDAGHGGRDSGTIGKSGTQEKNITLDVARRLKKKLEANMGYNIRLVRDDDVFVPLIERADFANSQATDLFVSIHVNYLPSTSTNAVETYYFGRHEDARTRQLAERENQGSEYSLSDFEGIMRSMQDTIKLQESKALAQSIQGSLLKSIRAHSQRVLDNGVRTAPFLVLLGVKSPSVLVEIGSLSSPDTERNLSKDTYRDEIATYVVAGIRDYLNKQHPEELRIHEKNEGRLAGHQ